MRRPVPWLARASWLVVAVATIPALSQALEGRSVAVRAVAGAEVALLWTTAAVAVLVPRTTTLTVYRLIAPLSLVVAVVVALGGADVLPAAVAVVVASAATAVACAGVTTDAFVDGSSYGAERRFSLRLPPGLMLGPVPLSWAVAVSAAGVPVLLAARQWIGAALVAGVAIAGGRPALRSLHQLARRWIVFVPAGMVVHDPLVLADAVLFSRRRVARLGPALEGTDATDLSGSAFGLALEARLAEPTDLSLRSGKGRTAREVTTEAVVFTPLRPGALLDAASEARITVG